MTEHLWLTAATCVPGHRVRHHDDDSHERSLGGSRRLSPDDARFHLRDRGERIAYRLGGVPTIARLMRRRWSSRSRRNWRPRPRESAVSPVDPGGDALVTACRTVGQSLGIAGSRAAAVGDRPDRARRATCWETWRAPPGFTCGRSRCAGLVAPAGGEPLLGQLADPGRLAGGPDPGEGRRAMGRGRPTACSIGKAVSRPVDRGSPGEAGLDGLDALPDRCPTNRSGRSTSFRFSLSLPGPGARAVDRVARWPFWRRCSACRSRSPPGILVDQVIPEADRCRSGLGS